MAPWDQPYPSSQPPLLDLLTANAWAPPNLPLLPSLPWQLPAVAEDQWRPDLLARLGNAQSDRFDGWPVRQAPANALPPPTVLAASDQALPRPWWGLPPGPSVFDEWKKWNDRGSTGLYNFLRSFGGSGPSSGGGRKSEQECEDQYREDGDICRAKHSRTCWAHAAVRYANCLHGDPIPPLGFRGR